MTVRWGREARGDSLDEAAKGSLRRARDLRASLGAHFDMNSEPIGIHGKVLLVDNLFFMVSSFNFLAFGGVAGRERTLSGELGVAVCNEERARDLTMALEAHDKHAPSEVL